VEALSGDVWFGAGQRITFKYDGEGELYGNQVYLRPAYLSSGANRSWIDINQALPAGVIERFYIYVHNVTQLDPQSRRVRLQIWRNVDVTLKEYEIVWMQLIQISAGYDIGALYSVYMYQRSSLLFSSRLISSHFTRNRVAASRGAITGDRVGKRPPWKNQGGHGPPWKL